MKIKHFKLVFAVIYLVSGACTNLANNEVDSIVQSTSGGFTPGDPAALLESAYKDLSAYIIHRDIFALGEVGTADLIPPTRGVDWGDNGVWRALEQHTWDATHSYVRSTWDVLNARVYKTTEIIASNPTPVQKAEAQLLRAFNMFWVMDFFGQVPFREVTQSVDDLPKVLTRSEAFDFIMEDLTKALPNLKIASPAPKNGRASKAAANFLLARLFLNKAIFKATTHEKPYTFDKADMDMVISLIDAIAADGYYLDPDYFNIFSNTSNAETIFVSNEGIPTQRWTVPLNYSQNPPGYNGFATLESFYNTFEDGDIRKGKKGKSDGSQYSGIGLGLLIGQQYDDNGKEVIDIRTGKPLAFSKDVPLTGAATFQGIRVIKYHPANYGQLQLMRFGEAILMKAEAQYRGGDITGALATVNSLRSVRKASKLSALTEEILFDEIGRETYWEGIRRTVEIRFGKFTSGEGVTKKDVYTILYPIPLTAIISNTNLRQNPGYQ